MQRRKRQETTNPVDAIPVTTDASEMQADEALHQSTNPASDEAANSEAHPKNQFRSWALNAALGYERLSDEQNNMIVLKFKQRPEADTLGELKAAGFQYQPEYFGQKKVWIRRNDFEGRLRVENIESKFRGVENTGVLNHGG